ncbi:phospholipase A2 isozymes PA3A/PA3B/PA5-like [Actinia tenebrosa]|uniref:Phospholipase A2 isozymes PA3A/PA3B/PA5-like n=1 Tax=Actinia tenebrosa TaxID=6105 RepID=A0A6P8HUG2_ACTTE|nr:phospholipase A2 isozymes PA3A/PA3B/PA5-like [Actinia tenebrosa]
MESYRSKVFVILAVILHASLCQAMYDWKTKTFIKKDNSKLVVPGTKWCGKGNNAMSFDDLGEHMETDLCCRKHDHCPEFILPFQRRFGILNLYPSHLSHCPCEKKFYDCLWNVTSPVAIAVGRMYFNVIRVPCFHLVQVKICKKRSFDWWEFKYVCKEYGVEFKGQTFMPNKFLKQLPAVQPSYWKGTTKGTYIY